ncbi:MAG: prolyl oligopeptidase family serine peptidase [Bacteroidota bacterium]
MKTLPLRYYGFAIALLLVSTALDAQNGKWSPKDLIQQESASDFDIAPNNQSVVWVKRRPSKSKDRFISDLYLTRLDLPDGDSFKSIRLTRTEDSDRNPRFSKDGTIIYFLSSRKKSQAIWALSIYGGEPYVVDSLSTSISELKVLDDRLIFRSQEGKSLYEMELAKAKDNVQVIEDTAHFKPSRIYEYHLQDKKFKRLTDNRFPIADYDISRDGKWLVTRHIMSPHYAADGQPAPKQYLWDLEAGGREEILTDYYKPSQFTFTHNSAGFYFAAISASDPEIGGSGMAELYHFDIGTKTSSKVSGDWPLGIQGYIVSGNDAWVQLANRTTRKLAYYRKNGDSWRTEMPDLGDQQDHVQLAAVDKDFTQMIFVYSTASVPNQYWIADYEVGKKGVSIDPTRELVKLNTSWEKKQKSRTENITWTGYNDDEVTGILYYPHDYEEAKEYPLIVAIHGGPTGTDIDRWSDRWAYFHNLIAQRGAFILKPNYHGSASHGLEFIESIKGNYYEPEMEDILKGIDLLDGQGKIDRDSMGVMGWSNGAILATMLTVRYPDLFRVAAAGAGDVNWTSDFGTCRFGVTFDRSYFGGAPWDDVDGKFYNEQYIIKSPLFELEKVTTPTIIFHGSEDRAVPRDQGWEYYRALQQVGKAQVRFLWFPGQPHGLQKLSHQLRKVEEEMAWFDQHLFGTDDPKNESFKPDSPLANLLAIQKAVTTEGHYGEMQNGSLIPEVVALQEDSISIGRFEVTNQQYHSHNSDHTFEATKGNHPVSGITFEQAQAYINWLNDVTGKSYRLPSADEGESLHKEALKVAAKENSLNYWAGYALTIDDAKELESKLSEVEEPLIKPVGSFKAQKVKNASLYDLGGNVAEFCQKNGGPGYYGFSAYDYVDAKGELFEPKVVGFRVVLEK